MAERRPPGFNVDLGFYDSAEVLSIPRKIRAAAIGVWTLCGAYSANKLSDGLVSAEALRDRGCTPAIREALLATTPDPLWEDAGNGAIQFTRWSKWQRTSAEVKAYRETDAERKRKAREAAKAAALAAEEADVDDTYGSRGDHVDDTWSPDEPHVPGDMGDTYAPRNSIADSPTSTNGQTSERTSPGRSQPVRSDHRDPKTETETETKKNVFGYVSEEATDPYAHGISATPGAELVRQIVPKQHPAATMTSLRMQASELLNNGTERSDVAEALRLWCSKPGVGIGRTILSSLVSEVIKARSPTHDAGRPPNKLRVVAQLAQEVRAAEQAAALAPVYAHPKELP